MLDALKPEDDLRLYSHIEKNKQLVEERRRKEMQEMQQHVKGEFALSPPLPLCVSYRVADLFF